MEMKWNRMRLVIACLLAAYAVAVAPAIEAGTAVSAKAKLKAVDLNVATAEQLNALPGIGARKAKAIVAFRVKNGPFLSAEDLLQVKGIGEKLLARIRPMITVKAKSSDLPKPSK